MIRVVTTRYVIYSIRNINIRFHQHSPFIIGKPFCTNNFYGLIIFHGRQKKHANNQFRIHHEADFLLRKKIVSCKSNNLPMTTIQAEFI